MIMNGNYGYTLFAAYRYDEAAQQFRKSIEMDPNSHTGHWKYSILLAVRASGRRQLSSIAPRLDSKEIRICRLSLLLRKVMHSWCVNI